MTDKERNDSKYDLEGEYNPSDSEDEYSEEDRRLLDKVRKKDDTDSENEEEVYGFSESESEKDDAVADSDIEGREGSGDELPDPRAWGQNNRQFYSTDYVDEDYGGFGKDEQAATLEEKEARLLQNKLIEHLEDDDFALDFFTSKKTDEIKENEKEIKIKSDLSELSKRQKLQLLDKESPEFSGLVSDFQVKLLFAKDTLLPVLSLLKKGVIPECAATRFITINYQLILNYCTNISFYLLLKSKKISIQNHPVIKRLYQYRQMLNQIEPVFDDSIKPQVEKILSAIENKESFKIINGAAQNKKRKTNKPENVTNKKLKLLDNFVNIKSKSDESNDFDDGNNSEDSDGSESADEKTNVDEENSDKEDEDEKPIEIDNVDNEGGEKRAITYQMAKNKGLTPHRKKEQRNPRVKHRNKYRKAKIRRKGAIREVRTETTRYAGEISGIKANVKKSIKIR